MKVSSFFSILRGAANLDNAYRFIDFAMSPQVQAPTLVQHSRGDTVCPFEAGRRIAAAIPGARLVALDSDNHVVLEGEPAWPRMLEEIERLLSSPGAGGALRAGVAP